MRLIKLFIIKLLIRITPKYDKVVVIGNNKAESNALELARTLASKTDKKVKFVCSKEFHLHIDRLLPSSVTIIKKFSRAYYCEFLTSQYVFTTHENPFAALSKRQLSVNMTHGVPYKTIRKLRDGKAKPIGVKADYTLATSSISQKILAQTYGVREDSVLKTGYPRNDVMLRAQTHKKQLLSSLSLNLDQYDKIVFWMPTYRRVLGHEEAAGVGMELKNPFEIKAFDVEKFNSILKAQNTFCLLKPHYWYAVNYELSDYSNILMIDDTWIAKQNICLYSLIGCTDILISDYSSVIVDYMLLDNPILTICTDYEIYKQTQGLYFDDYEAWIPSALLQEQGSFFRLFEEIVKTGEDPYKKKRENLKKQFFDYQDDQSTQRLLNRVLHDD